MHLTLNPFRWRKLAKHYATLYSKQTLTVINANEYIAELIAENAQKDTRIQGLQQIIKSQAEDIIKLRQKPHRRHKRGVKKCLF